jgi:hypothetical protein
MQGGTGARPITQTQWCFYALCVWSSRAPRQDRVVFAEAKHLVQFETPLVRVQALIKVVNESLYVPVAISARVQASPQLPPLCAESACYRTVYRSSGHPRTDRRRSGCVEKRPKAVFCCRVVRRRRWCFFSVAGAAHRTGEKAPQRPSGAALDAHSTTTTTTAAAERMQIDARCAALVGAYYRLVNSSLRVLVVSVQLSSIHCETQAQWPPLPPRLLREGNTSSMRMLSDHFCCCCWPASPSKPTG